jgi:hypothetical protein
MQLIELEIDATGRRARARQVSRADGRPHRVIPGHGVAVGVRDARELLPERRVERAEPLLSLVEDGT